MEFMVTQVIFAQQAPSDVLLAYHTCVWLLRDFRYALRTLWQSRGFTLTSIGVLALGIGANTSIFSVFYAVILRPLPYPDPSRLVFVWQRFPSMPAPFAERMFVAPRNYLEWQRQNSVFQEMGAYRSTSFDETSGDAGGKVATYFVSTSVFHLLGMQPRLGRLFRVEEARPGGQHVAILMDGYFDRRFHRDPKALGKSVTLDGTAYTIIGVLPAGFYMPRTFYDDSQPDAIVPLPDLALKPADQLQVTVMAQLRQGVSLTQARTEMAGIAERLNKADREYYELGGTSVFPFSVENTEPNLQHALYMLLAAAGFLLLIACANLANLTLARATMRQRDIIVRVALGAPRRRILGQLLSESLLVGIVGAGCGVMLAHGSIGIIRAIKPPDIQRPELIAINLPVLGFAAAAAVLTAVLFGLWPALLIPGGDLVSRLKTGGWGFSAARLRGRQFLIVCEVALALMLLTGAGLMIRSLRQIAAVGIGFDTAHLSSLDINLPEKRYPGAATRAGLIRRLIARVQTLPGVAEAAVTSALPLHTVGIQNFHIPGRPEPTRDASPVTDVATVSPGFFHAIGLRLEAGRWLTDADINPDGTRKNVAVVNQAFAHKYFPGENPLGKRLLTGDEKENFAIVGVVADYRPMGAENGVRPEIFRPSMEFTGATLVVRSRGPTQSVARSLLESTKSIAADLPADKVKTLDEAAEYWTSQRRFNTMLLGIFAGLALVLALLGIYGVLSNLVASRAREIGIRMAIGATPGAIGRLVLRQSMVPVSIGLLIGLAGCAALSRFIESLLFQVRAQDPLTLGLAVAAILLTSPAALYLPLRRATSVDCTVALRDE
jgi:putative ABC transport system permease protein